MIISRVGFAALLGVALTGGLEAQGRTAPSVARIAPYVGYVRYGNYLNGPLGTSIRNAGAPIIGAELGIDLTDNLTFVGNVGYSDSQLELGAPILGGLDVADSKVMLYDAGLQYRLPATSATGAGFSPFVLAGAGAMRNEIGYDAIKAKSTSLAFNFGGGVDVKLNERYGLRGVAKDYISKLDLEEALGFDFSPKTTHNWAFTAGLTIAF